jgi:hypothetical protein
MDVPATFLKPRFDSPSHRFIREKFTMKRLRDPIEAGGSDA